MPTLASPAIAGERTLLNRPRGVVAVTPASRGQVKFANRAVARKPSAALAQKRARCGFDVNKISEGYGVGKVSVVPARAPGHVKDRMETEHAARAGKDGARILDARRRPEAPSAEEAAKRRKMSSSKPASLAAHQRTEPAKQQPRPDQHRQRATSTVTQRPMSKLIEKAQEVLKKRRLEELARAREKFRRELAEVEKAAMPDETIYPEDLEELGLTKFQYAVTPTRKQALRRRLG